MEEEGREERETSVDTGEDVNSQESTAGAAAGLTVPDLEVTPATPTRPRSPEQVEPVEASALPEITTTSASLSKQPTKTKKKKNKEKNQFKPAGKYKIPGVPTQQRPQPRPVEQQNLKSREGSKIAQLETALAEAEEEKGSLQLKLVDLDKLTSNEVKLKNRIKDAEETSRRIGDKLDSQQRVNTMLESEKFDLMAAVATR